MSGGVAGHQLDWACQGTCAREPWGREMPDCSLSQAVLSALRPEKSWDHVIGRGFDSRHLHYSASVSIPLAVANVKLIPVSLVPMGKDIVRIDDLGKATPWGPGPQRSFSV